MDTYISRSDLVVVNGTEYGAGEEIPITVISKLKPYQMTHFAEMVASGHIEMIEK